MAADDLAMQGARASTAIILTLLNWNNSVLVHLGLMTTFQDLHKNVLKLKHTEAWSHIFRQATESSLGQVMAWHLVGTKP